MIFPKGRGKFKKQKKGGDCHYLVSISEGVPNIINHAQQQHLDQADYTDELYINRAGSSPFRATLCTLYEVSSLCDGFGRASHREVFMPVKTSPGIGRHAREIAEFRRRIRPCVAVGSATFLRTRFRLRKNFRISDVSASSVLSSRRSVVSPPSFSQNQGSTEPPRKTGSANSCWQTSRLGRGRLLLTSSLSVSS